MNPNGFVRGVSSRRLSVNHHENPAFAVVFSQLVDRKGFCRSVCVIVDTTAVEILDFLAKLAPSENEREFLGCRFRRQIVMKQASSIFLPTVKEVARLPGRRVISYRHRHRWIGVPAKFRGNEISTATAQ